MLDGYRDSDGEVDGWVFHDGQSDGEVDGEVDGQASKCPSRCPSRLDFSPVSPGVSQLPPWRPCQELRCAAVGRTGCQEAVDAAAGAHRQGAHRGEAGALAETWIWKLR